MLPSSLVKTIGAISGITAAYAIGTRMGETGLEHTEGKFSSAKATLEDLKAVGGTVPGMVKGAVKGVPGLKKDWRQEWATDPVGTAVGLLGLMGAPIARCAGGGHLHGPARPPNWPRRSPQERLTSSF